MLSKFFFATCEIPVFPAVPLTELQFAGPDLHYRTPFLDFLLPRLILIFLFLSAP